MADRQRNGVKPFVNCICCYDRQPVKTNSFKSNHGNASITLTKQNFVIPGSFFLIEVSYERAENELFRNVNFLLKFRYRPSNDFLVPFIQIVLNQSCVKYASYELHQMKEEYLSFTNMCHL